MQDRRELLGKTTIVMTGIILLSKLAGFVREMVIASYFGAGMQSDAYVLAYSILNVMVLLFSACVTSTFIPIYSRTLMKDGQRAADDFVNNVLHLFLGLALLVSFLGVIFAPNIVRVVAANNYDPQKFALTVRLLQIIFPCLVFSLISSVYSSVLNARYKFVVPQLLGFAISFCTIISVVFFSKSIGVYSLAYGTFFSMLMQILILAPFLKGEYKYYPRLNFSDEKLKSTLRLAIPILIGMTVNELNFMIDRSLASGLPDGSVSALRYAFNLINFVIGVFIVPITTIQFTKLSAMAAKDDKESMKKSIKQSIEMIAALVLPIVSISVVMSFDIIRIVYQRGEFGSAATSLTSTAFTFYIIGFLGYGLRELLNRSFYAYQDTRTPMISSVITISLNIVLNLILVKIMGVGGLALATSISSTIGSVLMMVLLRRKLGNMGMKSTLGQSLLILISSLACALAAYLSKEALTNVHYLMRFAISAGAGLVVYAILVYVFKVKEIRTLISEFTSKMRKRAH